jgi:hypothetical protein
MNINLYNTFYHPFRGRNYGYQTTDQGIPMVDPRLGYPYEVWERPDAIYRGQGVRNPLYCFRETGPTVVAWRYYRRMNRRIRRLEWQVRQLNKRAFVAVDVEDV